MVRLLIGDDLYISRELHNNKYNVVCVYPKDQNMILGAVFHCIHQVLKEGFVCEVLFIITIWGIQCADVEFVLCCLENVWENSSSHSSPDK